MHVGIGFIFENDAMFAPDVIARVARAADEAGFESLWAHEHIAFPARTASINPHTPDGNYPFDFGLPVPSPLHLLAFIAAQTRRVKLGTDIIILPQHHPLALAKDAASVDALSGGRLMIGVASGWLKEEYDALGIDFHARGARADEAIDAMRVVWRDDPASFEGRHFNFRDMRSFPKPLRRDIPIHIGGKARAVIRRAARVGNGVIPVHPGEIAPVRAMLAQECAAIGRNPAELEVTCPAVGTVEGVGEVLRQCEDLGATRVVAWLGTFGKGADADEYLRNLDLFAARHLR